MHVVCVAYKHWKIAKIVFLDYKKKNHYKIVSQLSKKKFFINVTNWGEKKLPQL